MKLRANQPSTEPALARRLRRLPRRRVLGREVPVAGDVRARAAGLALLRRERAGAGLLLERCNAIHTLGMRFPIEARFLDAEGRELRRSIVPPWRFVADGRATAVLELPIGGPADAA